MISSAMGLLKVHKVEQAAAKEESSRSHAVDSAASVFGEESELARVNAALNDPNYDLSSLKSSSWGGAREVQTPRADWDRSHNSEGVQSEGGRGGEAGAEVPDNAFDDDEDCWDEPIN